MIQSWLTLEKNVFCWLLKFRWKIQFWAMRMCGSLFFPYWLSLQYVGPATFGWWFNCIMEASPKVILPTIPERRQVGCMTLTPYYGGRASIPSLLLRVHYPIFNFISGSPFYGRAPVITRWDLIGESYVWPLSYLQLTMLLLKDHIRGSAMSNV